MTGAIDLLMEELTDSETPAPFFEWKGVEVPCLPSELEVGSQIEFGGAVFNLTASIVVKLSEFLSVDSTLITVDSELYTVDSHKPRPLNGQTLVYKGRTLRVASNGVDASNAFVEISLIDARR